MVELNLPPLEGCVVVLGNQVLSQGLKFPNSPQHDGDKFFKSLTRKAIVLQIIVMGTSRSETTVRRD